MGQHTVTLSNGLNSNIATNGQASMRIVGPTGQFSVGGFVLGASGSQAAGQILTVINTTTETLTIVDEDASTTSIYRIDTQSAVPVTLPPGRKGTATFVYDGTEQRWVLQNIGMAYPVMLNLHDYGAKGNGVDDDSGALIDAFAQAGTSITPATIVELAPGTYRISNNITQPAGVTLKFQPGAEISRDSGITLSILGMIDADKYQQIFSGPGATTFGSAAQSPQVAVIEACWFGADPTGTNDSYPAFKACENAWVALATSYSGGPNWPAPSAGAGYPNLLPPTLPTARRVHIPAGCYWMTKTWFIQHTDLEIEGDGAGSLFGTNTVIITPQGVPPLVQNVDCQPFTFRKIVLSCNGSNYNGNAPGVGAVIGTSGPYYPKWTPGTVYTAGQVVQLNYRQPYGYALQCVDGGTSAGISFPGFFEWTLTVIDSTPGDTIALNVMTNDNVIHRVSVAAGATTTATATLLAAAIVALPDAVDTSGSVTSSGPVVTLKRAQSMTLPGDWNTSQLIFAFSPSNTWRADEPDLVALVNTNGAYPPGAYNAYGLLRYWAPTTSFHNGDVIVEAGYFYTATFSGSQQSGSSGSTQPAFGGATVDDGSVVWTRGNSALIGDNTVTWQPVVCNAIDLLGGDARIEDVACFGYPGNGINVNSWFFADGFNCYVKNVQLYNMGGSDIFLTGGNTGAGNTFINVNGWYARGWHIFCEAATIDTFISCMNEDAESGYFYGDSGIVIGPFKEGSDSGVWLGVSAVMQGAGGGTAFITNSSLTESPAIYPYIGFSGNSAPTWQSIGANTAVAAGSLCTPQASSQPDPRESWTYYTPCGGTTGSSEPTWYPCYGQNDWPDASFVVDGSTIWKVYNYARKSTGQTLGLDADNQKAFVNNNGEYTVYLGVATEQTAAQTGTTTMAVESFSTSDPNDSGLSGLWGLYYDTTNKMFTWRKGGSAGPTGMSYLFANNAYGAPVNNIGLSCAAFQSGFYIGYPVAGDFCYFFAVENPGIVSDNQGLSFSAGAFCLSTGHGAPAGCANVFRNVRTGASYPIWKPNYAAVAAQYVLSDPPNGHLYKNTGTTGFTGTTPIVWPTSGGSVSDSHTGVEWTDEGVLAGGVTEWLPCAPAISEDIYYLNLSGQSSPYTLSAYETAHRIIRIFNASENFTIIVESPDAYPDGGFYTTALQGGINTWSKIFDNQTSYITTVAATPSDIGIAIAPDQGAFLWSDSINVKSSPPPTPTAVSTAGGADATLGTIGGSGPASAGQAKWLELFDASGQKYFVPAWQ